MPTGQSERSHWEIHPIHAARRIILLSGDSAVSGLLALQYTYTCYGHNSIIGPSNAEYPSDRFISVLPSHRLFGLCIISPDWPPMCTQIISNCILYRCQFKFVYHNVQLPACLDESLITMIYIFFILSRHRRPSRTMTWAFHLA